MWGLGGTGVIMLYLISGVSFVSRQAAFSRVISRICVLSWGRLSTYCRVTYAVAVVMRSGGRVIMLVPVRRPWLVSWKKATFVTSACLCVDTLVRPRSRSAYDISDYAVTVLFQSHRG